MTRAQVILSALDRRLDGPVDLTLYGRAAFALGFDPPPPGAESSLDVDVVLWLGQAEQLLENSNLWQAVQETNEELAPQGLYVSHFFAEDQVVLRPHWRHHRIAVPGPWKHLRLHRLSDEDLFLSKLMRDDPLDRDDARFLVKHRGWSADQIQQLILQARVPPIAEVQEQFEQCSRRFRNP